MKDYNSDADDLLWGPNRDKGKALLGAVNYLSGKGMNVFSFLTFNVAGDDENVFMHIVKKDLADYEANKGKKTPDKAWTTSIERLRMDVSKTAQWDRVMQYADRKGMFLHFKTSEAENCKLMDGGDLGPGTATLLPRNGCAVWISPGVELEFRRREHADDRAASGSDGLSSSGSIRTIICAWCTHSLAPRTMSTDRCWVTSPN